MLSVKKVLKQSRNTLNKRQKEYQIVLPSKTIPILPDAGFRSLMEKEVLPYLSSIRRTGYVASGVGSGRLYFEAYRPAGAQGAIVISHGFTESAEKYKEVIYYFTQAGYQVYIAEHRGHGRSVRDTAHPNMVHINHFSDYVRDLNAFIRKIVKPSANGLPLYLYAHSMGGAIGAFYLEAYPGVFQKAVLTAPMLSINIGALPSSLARAFGRVMLRKGRGESYVPGQHAYTPGEQFRNSCCSCPERYRYHKAIKDAIPLFQNSGSSYSWAYQSLNACQSITRKKNCARIKVPVLVFRSLNDDSVRAKGIRRFIGNTPSARLVKVTGSRHEIYNSPAFVLEGYYQKIFRFFGS